MIEGMVREAVVEGGTAGLRERGHALAAIGRTIDRAREGFGGCLIVRGEAGLGKTSLLAEARRLATPDMRVGAGRGDAMESWFPFGVIAPVLHDLGGPDLLSHGAGDHASGPDARASRFMAVLYWLQNDLKDPVLLILDDLHWADPDSLALIAFLGRRLSRLPVAMLGSMRPWPNQAEDVALELTAAGFADVQQLQPLSSDAASVLIEARVGHAVDDRVLKRAQELCAGNPLLLEQVAMAIDRGDEVPARNGSGGLPADALLLMRFAGLQMEGLRYAQAASVLGRSFRAEIVGEMVHMGVGATETAVEALTRGGLVRSTGGSVLEFVHPLFAQALYEGLTLAARSLMHRRAFRILCRLGLEMQAAEHALLGDLVGDRSAIRLLEDAGRRAFARGALAAAVTHLEAAARLAMDRAGPTLLFVLGAAELAGGEVARARATCERLLTMSDLPGLMRGETLHMLARALYVLGEASTSDLVFGKAVTELESQDRSAAAAALVDASLGAWLTTGPSTALALASKARTLASGVDEEIRQRTDAVWGYMRLLTGDGSGLSATEAAVRAVGADPVAFASDVFSGIGVLNVYANMVGMAERFDEAERVFRRGLAAAEQAGSPMGVATFANPLSWLLARMGRLDEALQLVRRSSALTDLVPFIDSFAAVGQAYILQLMGELEHSEAWCQQVEASAARRGQTNALIFLGEVRGHRALRQGRLRDAAEHYAGVEAVVNRTGNREPCHGTWARHAVAAYLGCDREADARRVVSWLECCAQGLPCSWPRLAAATGRALLAQRTGDHDVVEIEFRTALYFHQATKQPIEEAETLLEYGAFLRRSGQSLRARPLLARAVALAEQSGANWIADYVRTELTVAGGRRRESGSLKVLTAQEQRVADLARSGLSNKEIAARLSLSVPTIETHLQRVYAKLGIHSRRELMVREREHNGTHL